LSTDDRIKKTLEAVKARPNSESGELELETSVLNDLHVEGYITASVHTPLTGPQVFSKINLTEPGERYLESLKASRD
jgi:hypothetical protein